LQIDITQLKQSTGAVMNLETEIEMPPLEGERERITLLTPVVIDLQLKYSGGLVLVEGNIRVKIQLNCSRCLEAFPYQLEASISETYGEAHEEKTDAEIPEHSINQFTGDTVDFTQAIKENLLAALPMKAVCSADCRGLCPRCGQNLNLGECDCRKYEPDPRLAVLQKLIATDTEAD
jgi:uncharacterized protein